MPSVGDSSGCPQALSAAFGLTPNRRSLPALPWCSCRLANYSNNSIRPPAQAAAWHTGSEATPTV